MDKGIINFLKSKGFKHMPPDGDIHFFSRIDKFTSVEIVFFSMSELHITVKSNAGGLHLANCKKFFSRTSNAEYISFTASGIIDAYKKCVGEFAKTLNSHIENINSIETLL